MAPLLYYLAAYQTVIKRRHTGPAQSDTALHLQAQPWPQKPKPEFDRFSRWEILNFKTKFLKAKKNIQIQK